MPDNCPVCHSILDEERIEHPGGKDTTCFPCLLCGGLEGDHSRNLASSGKAGGSDCITRC